MTLNKTQKHNLLLYGICIIIVLVVVIYIVCDKGIRSLWQNSKDIRDLEKRTDNLIEQHEKNLQAINEKYEL